MYAIWCITIASFFFRFAKSEEDFFYKKPKWKHPELAAVDPHAISDGMVIKGNRNALFLVKDGTKHQFPDFYTFSTMGYNMSHIRKVPDDALKRIPLGPDVKKIEAPPEFRPDDYMYHLECKEPDLMVKFTEYATEIITCGSSVG